MHRPTRDRLNGLAAIVAIALLVVGVPLLLTRIAGWPFPGSIPDAGRVRRGITQGDIPAEVVVNVIAVVVWLIWAQMLWALIWEVAVNLPRVTNGRRTRPAPLVPAPVGNGIGRLVALVLAIGTVAASNPATAIALPTSSTRFATSPPVEAVSPATSPQRSTPALAVESPRWTVQRADSLWRIAEVALGDGERVGEILEHNRWLGSARHLKAGHVLVLPSDAAVPDDRQPAPPSPLPATAPAASVEVVDDGGYLPAADVVIERGDTLWGLAEDRLEAVDYDVTPGETLHYVNEVISVNPDVIEDPNLIYPGEVVAFPAVGTPPAPPPIAVGDPVDPPVETADPALAPEMSDSPAEPTPAPPQPQPDPPTTLPEAEQPAGDVPAAATPTTVWAPPTSPAATPRLVAGVHGEARASAVSWLAGITGATALASGILLAYRRRLAVRASRGASAYRAATPDDPSVLTAVTRASDVSLLRWVNSALADLMARLTPTDITGQPFAIELSEDSGLELLWTSPNRTALEPWRATDDGWAWQLAYDPDRPVDLVDRPAAIPALVTIGRRDGNQLLLNLEAVGTLAVDGDDRPTAEFVRALVAELAVGEILSDTYLVTTGIDLDGLADCDRLQRRARDDARSVLDTAVETSRAFLRDHALDTTFAARLGGDASGRETTIVAVDDEYAAPLHDHVAPGLAVCLIYTGAASNAPCVRIVGDDMAVLEPHGIQFQPATLPITTVEAVSDLLDEATEPYSPPSPALEVDSEPATDPEPIDLGGDDDDWTPPDPAVLVRVLGAPEVVGVTLGRIETSIITYLASHDGRRRDEQVINAVWNGRAIEPKTLWNRISKIRAVLGPELVPPRLPNSPDVVISPRVMTDLDVLSSLRDRAPRVSEAEALQLLLDGLDLIDGVPFDSAEYEWSFESQDHALACETVEAATLDCVEIAMNLGDLVAARRAVTQGLRALPLNEPLYRARMRIEAASGNPDGVRRALGELTTALGISAPGIDPPPEPEPETKRVADALVSA